jgi:hypothetical protein
MTTTEAETPIPQPVFPYTAYGVSLSFFGDEGGMIAPGRVVPRRFIAACNRIARKELGLHNVFDDVHLTLDDVLPAVTYRWAVPTEVTRTDYEWQLSYFEVTEHTPGAILFTILDV